MKYKNELAEKYVNKHVATWTGAAKRAVRSAYLEGSNVTEKYYKKLLDDALNTISDMYLEIDGLRYDLNKASIDLNKAAEKLDANILEIVSRNE